MPTTKEEIGGEGAGPAEGDQEIELAGELALAWCREQVREVAKIFPLGDAMDPFRCGYSAACEELEERFKEIRFSEILDQTMAGLGLEG